MLHSFLVNMRKQRCIGAQQALNKLGQGWTAEGNGALKREYQFESFEEATNFISRFTNYCHKLNHLPNWSNVYNRVTVELKNEEFNSISTKEVEIARYLDQVSQVKLIPHDQIDTLTYEQVIQLSGVDQSIDSVRNNQDVPTPLLGESERFLRLTSL